jgi:hypothetical protein
MASCSRICLVIVIGALALASTAGCGGTKKKGKKGGLTVAQQLEKAEKESTPDRQAAALLKVARRQFASGDKTGAKDSAKKALEKVRGEGDAGQFGPRLVEVAGFLAETGEKKPARDALKRATELAGSIADPVRRASVLAEAGGVYGDKTKGLGDAKAAKDVLGDATKAAEETDERFRAEALAAVALGYTRSGLADAASDMVGKLEEAAKGLEEPRAKAEALAAAANVKAQTGKKDEAASLLDEAAKAAKSVERSESRAYALLAVATALDANGATKDALALLKEADKAANKVAEPDAMKTIVDKVRALTLTLEKK